MSVELKILQNETEVKALASYKHARKMQIDFQISSKIFKMFSYTKTVNSMHKTHESPWNVI